MSASRVLITDFDGTVCRNEFYLLVRDRLLPEEGPDFWQQFVTGRVTHLQALQAYFSAIRATEEETLAVLDDMQMEPRFAELVGRLQEADWEIIVASAGCSWYIDRLLGSLGVNLTVHANPGYWGGGDLGLVMEAPIDSEYFCPEHGINKAAIVADALQRADRVVFAGDGLTDVAAMLLLHADCRFARRDAAAELDRRRQHYQPFERWAEVALKLLESFS